MSKSQRLLPFYMDVTAEPFGADSTGRADSTDAIRRAIDAVLGKTHRDFQETLRKIEALPCDNGRLETSCENRKQDGKVIGIFPQVLPYAPTLYFPAGTYLVSDTLSYSFGDLQNSFGNEICWQIRIRGAGARSTVIRLADNSEGFDGAEPKPVVSFMRGKTSNVAMSNYFEDLSIDTGRGNPAAVGLDFFANNSGAVRSVRVSSRDGRGYAGIQLGHRNYSGVLLKHIEVDGLDHGLHLDSGSQSMFVAAEHISVKNAKEAGIFVGEISASLRGIYVSNCAAGVVCAGISGHTVLLDSHLEGTGESAVDHRAGVLYASNVETSGFARVWASPAAKSSNEEGDKSRIIELVLPLRLGASPEEGMARLTVEETPPVSMTPISNAAIGVKAFGACGDGVKDDSVAVQAALDSGVTEVFFEPGKYKLCQPLLIPAHVNRICFGFCDLVAGDPLAAMADQGAFVISEYSAEPLLIEDLFAWEAWRGKHVMFDHACRRTLVLSDLHAQTLSLYRNSVEGGKVFLENVCCTAGVVPGTTGHGRACMVFRGQQVWARQLNPERGEPMVLNDGGALWVLGFKTEDEGVAFHTINGGRSEILGGILNGGRPHATAFVTEDAFLRVSAASNGWIENAYFGTAVRESRAGEDPISISQEDCVSRKFKPKRGKQFSIPLYVSRRSQIPPKPTQMRS